MLKTLRNLLLNPKTQNNSNTNTSNNKMANSSDFKGKVAIITGASSGIGEGIAKYLAELGAQVVITGRNKSNLNRVAKVCQTISPKGLKVCPLLT